MNDHEDLCVALCSASALTGTMAERSSLTFKAALVIEQQAARIAELERSPWRPMSEAPEGNPLCAFAFSITDSTKWAVSNWNYRSKNAIAWMPIPKYQEPTK